MSKEECPTLPRKRNHHRINLATVLWLEQPGQVLFIALQQTVRFLNVRLKLLHELAPLGELLFQQFNQRFACLVFTKLVALEQHEKDVVRQFVSSFSVLRNKQV